MSKLAREIVGKAIENSYSIAPEGCVLIQSSDLESIVDAKLEPVRKAFVRAIGWINNPPFGEAEHCQMEESMQAVLDMLSEDAECATKSKSSLT